MMNFLIENIGTIVVGLIVLAVITLIVMKLRSDKKHGKSSCGCGCKDCANAAYCHAVKK